MTSDNRAWVSDNKLIGREDRQALSSHCGRGGFLAGGGPMECRPRDLVQVWAAEPGKARQARDGPNQRKRLSGGHSSQFTSQGGQDSILEDRNTDVTRRFTGHQLLKLL